jgi:UDP-N-acetylglucosamine 2-epimerase
MQMTSATDGTQLPIYVVIGTRGQFTKTAPVLQEFEKRSLAYRLINTGQHTVSSAEIAALFTVRAGDVYLTERTTDIEKPREALQWFLKALWALIAKRRSLFSQGRGLVVIHGDTLSTLAGLMGARFSRMPVAHLESGLRSHSYAHPFPEEIIRVLCCRYAHYLFAPSEDARNNLSRYRGKSFCTQGNTIFDAIERVSGYRASVPAEPYCVATIHRSEVIFRDDLFRIALSAVHEASTMLTVVFVVHTATMARLDETGERERIERNSRIRVEPYYSYPAFMALIKSARFVMTDGGGLQEETFFLNVPCLLLRKRTERHEGLGSTALLSELDPDRISRFLKSYDRFKRPEYRAGRPSEYIAEKVEEIVCAPGGS